MTTTAAAVAPAAAPDNMADIETSGPSHGLEFPDRPSNEIRQKNFIFTCHRAIEDKFRLADFSESLRHTSASSLHGHWKSQMNDETLNALAEGVRDHKFIENLVLQIPEKENYDFAYPDSSGANLIDAIFSMKRLRTLVLNRVNVSETLATVLAKYVRTAKTLTELTLVDAELPEAGAEKLAQAVAANAHLKSLNLQNNPTAVEADGALVAAMIQRPVPTLALTLPSKKKVSWPPGKKGKKSKGPLNVPDIVETAKAIADLLAQHNVPGDWLADAAVALAAGKHLGFGFPRKAESHRPPALARSPVDWERNLRFCVELAIACAKQAPALRTTNHEQADTSLRAGRTMQLALCGVLPYYELSAAEAIPVLERATQGELTLLIALPHVQQLHWDAFLGDLGAFLRIWVDAVRPSDDVIGPQWLQWLQAVGALALACLLQPVVLVVLILAPSAEGTLRHLFESLDSPPPGERAGAVPVLQPPAVGAPRKRGSSSLVTEKGGGKSASAGPKVAARPGGFWQCLDLARQQRLVTLRKLMRHGLWVTDPWLRLGLNQAFSTALLVSCVWLPPHPEGPGAEPATFAIAAFGLATAAGSVLVELEELVQAARESYSRGSTRRGAVYAALSVYATDEFNLFDVFGLLPALASLAAHVLSMVGRFEEAAPWVHACTSVAVLFLTMRLSRVYYLSSWVGPYLSMIMKMANDVSKVVCLGMPVVIAFALAMHVLFKGTETAAEGGCETEGDPEAQEETEAEFRGSVVKSFMVLVEIVIGGDESRFQCLRQSSAGILAWWLQLFYMIIAVVLLLNVVIASMAKTFDLVFERLDHNAMFVKTKLIQTLPRLPVAAAPLNLVGVPARLLHALGTCVFRPPHGKEGTRSAGTRWCANLCRDPLAYARMGGGEPAHGKETMAAAGGVHRARAGRKSNNAAATHAGTADTSHGGGGGAASKGGARKGPPGRKGAAIVSKAAEAAASAVVTGSAAAQAAVQGAAPAVSAASEVASRVGAAASGVSKALANVTVPRPKGKAPASSPSRDARGVPSPAANAPRRGGAHRVSSGMSAGDLNRKPSTDKAQPPMMTVMSAEEQKAQLLQRAAEQYVNSHLAEAEEDSRWRKSLSNRQMNILTTVDAVHDRVAQVNSLATRVNEDTNATMRSMRAIKASQESVKEEIRELTKTLKQLKEGTERLEDELHHSHGQIANMQDQHQATQRTVVEENEALRSVRADLDALASGQAELRSILSSAPWVARARGGGGGDAEEVAGQARGETPAPSTRPGAATDGRGGRGATTAGSGRFSSIARALTPRRGRDG